MNTQDKQQRKHKRPWRRITAAVILLLMSAVLMILSARVPDFAEWYSEHIYPLAVNSIGRVSGTVPFSVSEIGIYILLILFVATLIRMIARMASGKGSKAGLFVSWISGVLLAAGILAFLYTVCCGINYHRRSFSEEEFPTLKGYYPQPKELLISEILSYQGLTGIYLPFTVEANYNGDMPRTTSCLLSAMSCPISEDLWRSRRRTSSRFLHVSDPSGRTSSTADICPGGCTA